MRVRSLAGLPRSNRLIILLTLVGAGLALSLALSTPAEAGKPNPVVTLAEVSSTASSSVAGGCSWTFVATWDANETTGPKVSYQFVELLDGDLVMIRGFGYGIPGNGEQIVEVRNGTEGDYTFEFRLQKGPKHVIATDSIDVTCEA